MELKLISEFFYCQEGWYQNVRMLLKVATITISKIDIVHLTSKEEQGEKWNEEES